MSKRLSAVAFVLSLLAPVAAIAQSDASLSGTVVDESQAVLPGVSVTAVEISSGRQYVAVTDARGQFRMTNVSPGKYRITSELTGFGTVVIPQIELLVGQNANIPFTMKVASLQETVTVTSEAPLVDIASSQVTGNIDRRQMEELPLQGRNWQELALLIKGITSNNATNTPGVERDDAFQLNLDGQQITQRVAGSGFGQPKISREAIAEFQVITNMFDITQGRSTGMQVQAISRSGSNDLRGGAFGFFRSDRFNEADPVAQRVLPFQNQQVGGSLGGPIKRDRAHFFAAYEYERQPNDVFLAPTRLPLQTFQFETKAVNKNYLGRVDYQISSATNVSIRAQRWDYKNPFMVANGTDHPSRAEQLTQGSQNIFGNWSRVVGSGLVLEVRGGYNGFFWKNDSLPQMDVQFRNTPFLVPEFSFPGLTIGGVRNYPNYTWQDTYSGRFDAHWNKGRHEVKLGVEYLRVLDTKDWALNRRGTFVFTTRPSDAELERRFPASAWDNPAAWDVSGLEPFLQRFDINFHPDYVVDVPRPTLAMWVGDNWRVNDQLTVNLGVRWDADWGATDPPHVKESVILIDNGVESGDFGYKRGIKDIANIAPRVGFAYNVAGKGKLVLRGGSGLYFNTPVSNVTYSHQFYSNAVAASLVPTGPGFIENPTRGVSADDYLLGRVPIPVQAARVISPKFVMPYTWQSSIGFQQQFGPVLGFEADLTHWKWYHDTRTRDVNLFYDPATGYNRNPAGGNRPNKSFTQVNLFESNGKQDYLALSTALTRRMRNRFSGGTTYTYVFFQHDDGVIGYVNGSANNQFDSTKGEWARSTAFQRHTFRLHGTATLPYDISASLIYMFGSGNYFQTSIATSPYGKPGTNRLNLGSPITIPEAVRDRFDGPDVIATGAVIPRNALRGLPLHKVDLRVSKRLRIGHVSLTGLAEVFNLFNHANYGGFNGQVDSASFGAVTATAGNAFVPRSGQLGFRLDF